MIGNLQLSIFNWEFDYEESGFQNGADGGDRGSGRVCANLQGAVVGQGV
jgi:hypothetical protein